MTFLSKEQSNFLNTLGRTAGDIDGIANIEPLARAILDVVPEPLYVVNAVGRIIYFNEAAAVIAGRRPELGKGRWCVFSRLWHLDGTPVALDKSALARVVRDGWANPVGGWKTLAERPDGSSVVITSRAFPLHDEAGRVVGGVCVIYDISHRTDPQQTPAETAFFAQVLESAEDCVKVLSLDGRLISMNKGGRKALRITDFEPYRNTEYANLWTDEDRPAAEHALAAARAGGTGRFSAYLPTADGEPRWWDLVVNAMCDSNGAPEWLVMVSRDVTDRHLAEQRQRIAEAQQQTLREELNHRVKNTLATVMSLAFQTSRTATSLEAFNISFKDRLMVLSKAHDLLTRRSWTKVPVSEVLTLALGDSLATNAVIAKGASVEIAARAAVSLALALRELANNAIRHGALAQPGGKLAISWSQGTDPSEVELKWDETSPVKVAPPAPDRLGLRLLRSMVEGDLGGALQMDFQPSGLKAAMKFKAAGATA